MIISSPMFLIIYWYHIVPLATSLPRMHCTIVNSMDVFNGAEFLRKCGLIIHQDVDVDSTIMRITCVAFVSFRAILRRFPSDLEKSDIEDIATISLSVNATMYATIFQDWRTKSALHLFVELIAVPCLRTQFNVPLTDLSRSMRNRGGWSHRNPLH